MPSDRVTITDNLPVLSEKLVFNDDDFRVFENQDFVDTVPAEPKQVDVIIKGQSIVSIEMGDGRMKLVVFNPSLNTKKSVKNFEGIDVALHIEDSNGMFVPNRPQFITGSVYEAGNNTMVIDTENQL